MKPVWRTIFGLINLQAEIKVRTPDWPEGQFLQTSIGRIIFNESINTALREVGSEPYAFINEMMDKGALKRIVARLIHAYGNQATAATLGCDQEARLHVCNPLGADDRHWR